MGAILKPGSAEAAIALRAVLDDTPFLTDGELPLLVD